MEPISVAASVIAFLQAASIIGNGIKTMRPLGKAPAELCALLNELATLQALATQLEANLSALYGPLAANSKPERPSDQMASQLEHLQRELLDTVNQLQSLVNRFIHESKGLNIDGQHRISRLRWQLEQHNIQNLRDRARQARENLTAFMTSLSFSQRCSFIENPRLF